MTLAANGGASPVTPSQKELDILNKASSVQVLYFLFANCLFW